VDTPPPEELDVDDLQRAAVDTWGLPVDELRYVPKGAGSYHWIAVTGGTPRGFLAVDDLDTKPWISELRDAAFRGLAVAYGAAWILEHESGIPFAVGPLRTKTGSVLVRLSDRHSLAVFPFVAGTPGAWGDPLQPAARDTLIRELAGLHRSGAQAGGGLRRQRYTLPRRRALSEALGQLSSAWDAGPLSEPARHALGAHVDDVAAWLDEFDSLVAEVTRSHFDPVVTHGEPHPGNVIHTETGLRLIDWDTVALADPERDLWMLEDASPGCLRHYEELTGRVISEPAVRLYRLAWSLSDIASFTAMFRAPHQQSQWLDQKFAVFERLLAGDPSAPYTRR
jgi:spectinomycin phosphotransferase